MFLSVFITLANDRLLCYNDYLEKANIMKKYYFLIGCTVLLCASIFALLVLLGVSSRVCRHELIQIASRESSCIEEGNIEYWQCTKCNKIYKDGSAETEITEVVIPKIPHALQKVESLAVSCTEDGRVEHWHCTACQRNFSDETGETSIPNVIIPSEGHQFGEYKYDYTEKIYSRACPKCTDTENVAAGESTELPLLARDETELAEVIASVAPNSFIKLANDITITTGMYAVVHRIPDGGTLDLGGYTVTVKNNGGFVLEGTKVTVQNGSVATDYKNPKEGYSLYVGDEGENNSVTLKNLDCRGGINVYNCKATVIDCVVDNSNHTYYALWGDMHSSITVESGVFMGGENGCVHSYSGPIDEESGEELKCFVTVNGGEFHGVIHATDLTVINGGTFEGDIRVTLYTSNGLALGKLIVNKDYDGELNIVCGSASYTLAESADEEGNRVYEMQLPAEGEEMP